MKINLPIQAFLFQIVRYHNNPTAIQAITELLTDTYLVPEEVTDKNIETFAQGFNNSKEIELVKTQLLEWKRLYLHLRYPGPM
jgi:hypothetical protein